MRMSMLGFFLISAVLQANAFGDLKASLAQLQGQDPVKARVDYQFWRKSGDGSQAIVRQGKAQTLLEDGSQGFRMMWSQDTLRAAEQDAKTLTKNPEAAAPTRQAIEAMGPMDLWGYLNGAGELLRSLDQAEVIDERQETWQGQPARLLMLKVTPRLSKQESKYVKELETTAKIWIGPNGVPFAAERRNHVKGRAFLVITFESSEKDEYHFAKVGNRLVVTHHAQEHSGSGGGEQGQRKTLMTLTLN